MNYFVLVNLKFIDKVIFRSYKNKLIKKFLINIILTIHRVYEFPIKFVQK